jgi:hypothetical protein
MKKIEPPKIDLEDAGEDEKLLEIDSSQLKAIKSWEVGKKYTLIYNVTMKKMETEEDETSGEFEINSIKEYKKPVDKREEYPATAIKRAMGV